MSHTEDASESCAKWLRHFCPAVRKLKNSRRASMELIERREVDVSQCDLGRCEVGRQQEDLDPARILQSQPPLVSSTSDVDREGTTTYLIQSHSTARKLLLGEGEGSYDSLGARELFKSTLESSDRLSMIESTLAPHAPLQHDDLHLGSLRRVRRDECELRLPHRDLERRRGMNKTGAGGRGAVEDDGEAGSYAVGRETLGG